MRFDKLTIKSQEAVSEAQSLATARGHSQITPSHLLKVLLEQPEGSTVPILQKIGIPIDGLQTSLEGQLQGLPKVTGGAQPQPGICLEMTWIQDRFTLFRQIGPISYTPSGHNLRRI